MRVPEMVTQTHETVVLTCFDSEVDRGPMRLTHWPRSSPSVVIGRPFSVVSFCLCFLDSELGCRVGLQPFVGDRHSASDGAPKRMVPQPFLGSVERSKFVAHRGRDGVVDALGIQRFRPIRVLPLLGLCHSILLSRFGDAFEEAFHLGALGAQEDSCAFLVHGVGPFVVVECVLHIVLPPRRSHKRFPFVVAIPPEERPTKGFRLSALLGFADDRGCHGGEAQDLREGNFLQMQVGRGHVETVLVAHDAFGLFDRGATCQGSTCAFECPFDGNVIGVDDDHGGEIGEDLGLCVSVLGAQASDDCAPSTVLGAGYGWTSILLITFSTCGDDHAA